MKRLLSLLVFASALFADEGGNIAWNHKNQVNKHLLQFLPNRRGTVALIGLHPDAVESLSKQYQYDFIRIIAFNFEDKKSWGSILEDNHLENKFDCFFATNILEREANREEPIRLAYDLLKPGGQGFFCVDGPEVDTFDGRLVYVIHSSRRTKSILLTPGLTIPEYRELIERGGFLVSNEYRFDYRLVSSLPFFMVIDIQWICNRLGFSWQKHTEFLDDFERSLRASQPSFPHNYMSHDFHSHTFLVEKR